MGVGRWGAIAAVGAVLGCAVAGCANVIGLSDLEEVPCVGAGCVDASTADTSIDSSPIDSGGVDSTREDTGMLADSALPDTTDGGEDADSCAPGCGGCGRICSTANAMSAACAADKCTPVCNSGYGDCTTPAAPAADDGCETKLDTSTACGACGHTCSTANATSTACSTEKCAPVCVAGFADCSTPTAPAADDGCETRLDSTMNCGACGRTCSLANASSAGCSAGKCVAVCNTGYGDCLSPTAPTLDDGCETKLDTINACGACGVACDTTNSLGTTCDAGVCKYTGCKPGYADCDTSGANANGCESVACGGCGTTCDAARSLGGTCSGSGCTYTGCKPGFLDCNTSGTNAAGCETAVSATNCGGCGIACDTVRSNGASCTGTACAYSSCKAGFLDCDKTGANLNGCETPASADNCAGCGFKCDTTNSIGAACPTGGACTYSACRSGFGNCSAASPDLDGCETPLNTTDNCGACGNRCDTSTATAASCVAGVCVYTCRAGLIDCDKSGANTNGCETSATAVSSCGGCGNVCDTAKSNTPSCTGTTCLYASCKAGFANCSTTSPDTDGCETSTMTTANCGGCGNACTPTNASGATCGGTACSYTCQAGYSDCDTSGANLNGCETSTSTDPTNCGGCGSTCDTVRSTGTACSASKCTYSGCSTGYSNCNTSGTDTNGCETATGTDIANCGTCSRACATTNVSTRTCAGGACTSSCSAGYSNCNRPTSGPDDGCECATPACCGTGCATTHKNCIGTACSSQAMGQNYWLTSDPCRAVGTPGTASTYTQAMAIAAANSWPSRGSVTPAASSSCSGVIIVDIGSACAVWGYGGTLAGRVHFELGMGGKCYCPIASDPTWN